MLCPSCGKEVAETDAKCGSCGSSLFLNLDVAPTFRSAHAGRKRLRKNANFRLPCKGKS